MRLSPDDDVTTFDGRCGIVVGIDGDRISVLDDGTVFDVRAADIATINQQETRPRAGAFPPPGSPSGERVRQAVREVFNDVRRAAGLPTRDD